jgi:hypothetical protein
MGQPSYVSDRTGWLSGQDDLDRLVHFIMCLDLIDFPLSKLLNPSTFLSIAVTQ